MAEPEAQDEALLEQEIFAQWQLPKRYQPIKIIGCGSYSIVFEALDTTLNIPVAIKRIDNLF